MVGDGKDHFSKLAAAMSSIALQLDPLYADMVRARIEGSTVWLCGNGGSFAVAQHWACDLHKVCGIRTQVLGSNGALLMAWANDTSYADALANELDRGCKLFDRVIALSCSGMSPNIARAIDLARQRKCPTTLVTGMVNHVVAAADYIIRIPSNDYGVIEDTMAAIGHYLTKELKP